jgi:hypothetical protein
VGCKTFFEDVKKMREIQKSVKNKHSILYAEKNKPMEKRIDDELKLIMKSSADDYNQGIKGYGSYRDNQFVKAVQEMRIEQKNYISTSSANSKRLSHKREKDVDELIEKFIETIHPKPTQLCLEL